MAILDNYMFWPLLAIFRLSLRELKVLLYTYTYTPFVSVFPACSSFTPGWVYFHVGGGTLHPVLVEVWFECK